MAFHENFSRRRAERAKIILEATLCPGGVFDAFNHFNRESSDVYSPSWMVRDVSVTQLSTIKRAGNTTAATLLTSMIDETSKRAICNF